MRYLPLLLVSLALVAEGYRDDSSSEEDDDDQGCGGRESLGDLAARAASRIDAQAFRLERLTRKLEKLQGQVDEVEYANELDHTGSIQARIEHLEGGECHQDEFTCGRDHECTSDLVVCDHYEDCHNGHDEDVEVCTCRTKTGDVFHGHVRWTACRAYPEGELTITITRNEVLDYFNPRVWVSASVRIEHDEGRQHIGHAESHDGYYNYGHRRLVLQPAEGDHIGIKCEFFSDDLADCVISEQGASTDCAHVRIVREGH